MSRSVATTFRLRERQKRQVILLIILLSAQHSVRNIHLHMIITLRLNARFSTVYGYRGLRDGFTKMAGRFLKSLIQRERYTRLKNRNTGTAELTAY